MAETFEYPREAIDTFNFETIRDAAEISRLAAEVERLQGLLDAARWKVEQLPRYEEHMCTIEVLGANDLDLANEALDRARRAVGLEEGK